MSGRPPIIVTEDTPPDMLAGSMDLTVVLPDGHSLKMSVERSTPMMDLLVQMTTANKMSPAGYIIKPLNERGPLPYKPSTPIGALDAWTIHIVPKQHAQCTAVKKPLKTLNQPFEQTFRLQVHLPRNQLYVARVSPKTRLADILLQVCSEKNLDPLKYSLRHPSNLDKVLSLSCSLADYKLQEVTLVCNRSHPVEVSTVDIMSLQRETSNPAYRSTMCEGSVSSGGSLEGRSLSPVPSDESSASPPPLPPSRPTRKRRPAPKPPTTNQKVLNEEKQQNGIQPSTLIYHSRNSSDSSGYHEASVLSESPQSNNGPEVLLQSKMASVSEGAPVSREATLSQSMTDVTVIESSLHQATSYSSITSLSSITGRKKKTAPPPPVATNRASSLIEDQQRTPSVSSTASSTTTLDGNEVNVAVKSATLPPSSRLNIVPKKLSPPSSPTPTTKVDVVEPPVTPQVAPAPRPRSKLFIDPEQVSWQILSDSATRGKLPSPKKLPAPQPKPRQLLLSSKSVDKNKITEIIETPIERNSTTLPELTHKKLLRSKFGSHQAYIEELTLKLERRGSESSESRVVEVENQDAIENQDIFIWNDINSSPVRNSSSNVDVSKPVGECEQQMSGEKPPADQAPAWVVEPNSGADESTSDIKEIDRIFASAIENHTSFEFGAEEDQLMSLPALPSPPSSLTQCELKQPSQSDEPLDWEYRLPAPPTFRDEARSPSLTEFGTMTLGDFNENLCSETVKQDNLNKTDVQKIIECEERMKEDNVLIDTVKLKSCNNEINDSSITKEKTVASLPKQQISSSFGDFENEMLKDLASKQCLLEPLEKNVINELVSTLSVKPSKVEISDIENKQFSQELSSSSTLDNFTITTYKDTKPVEVFEDDSIKSSVGEKRDKSKDDAVFRAPKHRIKEPKLSRTSSFSMESNLNGPLIKRSVSYVSLLAANMPRNSQPYRAHLMRQHSCASKDSQDLWPRLRKTSSEVNIDIKDGTTKETSFWQDDPSELQSVQVLRNILSRSQASLASSLDETDDLSHLQQRDPPISEQRLEDTFDQSSDGKKWGRSQSEEVSSSINWVPKTRMVHSASLDQEQTKPITNIQRGQPSINLSTWSERPKRLISLKNDCDYTSGFGKKNTAQDDGTAGAKNKDSISSAKIVHSTNNSVRVELTSKNEVFKVDGRSKSTSDLSRIPIVRAVELKKPFAVNNFDRVSLKPVQSLDDRKNNSPTKSDEVTNNSDESFIGVNSLARKFGVPQKRPVSLYVNSNSKINDLHAEIETFKPLKNTVHHSGNKFPEVDSASKMGENVFRVNKKVERYNESQIKISALHNKTDSTTSEIKALAKIRSGGFVEDTPIVSSLKGLNHSEKSRAPLNSYLSRHEENVSDTDSLTINATVSNGNSITSIGDSKSPVVPNVSVVSSSTQRGVSSSVFVRQTLDRKARPLSLQPVVKGFRVQTEAISKPTKDLTLHSSPPPKTKDLTISSASLSNNKTSSDDFVTKSMYHRALSTPSISLFSSTSIKEAAKDKNTEKVDLEPLYQKVTSQTVPPPPPPPPELPVLKPVGDRKNVKLLPPPQAKPRDQLMQSIRSFGIDGLKKVSK